jgi:hypothetical protein
MSEASIFLWHHSAFSMNKTSLFPSKLVKGGNDAMRNLNNHKFLSLFLVLFIVWMVALPAAVSDQPTFTRELREGDAGEDVRAMQQRLYELGYLTDEPNGSFDGETVAALTAFQRDNDLLASGILDQITFQMLFAEDARPAAPITTEGLADLFGRSDEMGSDPSPEGVYAQHVCVTDGRYVYMRAGRVDVDVYEYTLMPTHMAWRFQPQELHNATLAPPFSFTKGCPVLKIPKPGAGTDYPSMLFDTKIDPSELKPLHDPAQEKRMAALMKTLMHKNDAPLEQFERLNLI